MCESKVTVPVCFKLSLKPELRLNWLKLKLVRIVQS